MTISYIGSDVTTSGPPFVPSEPSGTQQGDFIIAYGSIGSNDGVWSIPSDFTLVAQQGAGTGSPVARTFVAYKTRGADTGQGYSFGYSGTDTSCRVALLTYRPSTGLPIVLSPPYNNSLHYNDYNNSVNGAAPAITTTKNDTTVVLLYLGSGDTINPGLSTANSYTAAPSGFSQHFAALGSTNIYMCDQDVATPTTITPGSYNWDVTSGPSPDGTSTDVKNYTLGLIEDNSINPLVKSIERVTVDWDATSEPVTQNLSKGQDETQCVPFFTKRMIAGGGVADDWRERTMKVEMIDNGGTPAVRVSAAGKTDADDHRIECYVVEFESQVTVQQVDADIADTAASANISITDVGDQTSAFFLYSYQYTHGTAQDRADYGCVRPVWNGAATNSITIQRSGTTGTIDGMLYVVSCELGEFSVQHRDIAIASTDELTNDTISAVTMARSFLLTHFMSDEAEDDPLDWAFVADLTTTTNVRVRRSIAGASVATGDVAVQVVTCSGDQWTTQRGDFVTTSNLTETTAFAAVDLTRAFVKTGTHESGLNSFGTSDLASGNVIDQLGPAAYLSANNQITWTRILATETGNIIPWEVIQFTAGLDNAIYIPTGPLR